MQMQRPSTIAQLRVFASESSPQEPPIGIGAVDRNVAPRCPARTAGEVGSRLVGVALAAHASRERLEQLRIVRSVGAVAFAASASRPARYRIVLEYEGT